MSTLYWITVLGNLSILMVVLFVISVCTAIVGFICVVTDDTPKTNKCIHNLIKARNYGFIASVFSLLGILFIPTTEQLYMIYGVGGTIDYLKENPTAKELPDKCIKALDTWVDNLNKEGDGQ